MLLCFSMFLILSLKTIKDKRDVCKGNDCMKKVCESLSEHTMKIIDLKWKKTKLLNKNAKICYICKEKFEDKYAKDKKF